MREVLMSPPLLFSHHSSVGNIVDSLECQRQNRNIDLVDLMYKALEMSVFAYNLFPNVLNLILLQKLSHYVFYQKSISKMSKNLCTPFLQLRSKRDSL